MDDGIRLLVCGGRDYQNRAKVFLTLDGIAERNRIMVVIHGACQYRNGVLRGADRWADEWATDRGYQVMRFPAEWTLYNKAAGPIRNKQMKDEGKPTHVVGFCGGDGTAGMLTIAAESGLQTWHVDKPPPPPHPDMY